MPACWLWLCKQQAADAAAACTTGSGASACWQRMVHAAELWACDQPDELLLEVEPRGIPASPDGCGVGSS